MSGSRRRLYGVRKDVSIIVADICPGDRIGGKLSCIRERRGRHRRGFEREEERVGDVAVEIQMLWLTWYRSVSEWRR